MSFAAVGTTVSAHVRGLDDELASCRDEAERCGVSAATLQRVWPLMVRFATFVRSTAMVESLNDVAATVVDLFVTSRLISGRPPTLATMHDRRSTVRLLFRLARRCAIVTGDPTLDVVLAARSTSAARPLTDVEIELGRDTALWSLESRRIASIWALSEATGRGAELGTVRVRHVNLGEGRVWLSGGARTTPRWGHLTSWGASVLTARLAELGDDREVPVGYGGTSTGLSPQVSTCTAISRVLVRCGLAGEADVRPTSVAAWAGRRVFDQTGSIERTALTLGVRSLDQAARIIGWDWDA
jgi:hypothetical protein